MEMLCAPNPHGRPNSDVIVPWINGLDVTRRPRSMWIIDFGVDMTQEGACRYERPFYHVECHVRPERQRNKRQAYRERWWIHVEARPAMRVAFTRLGDFLATLTVSKHRLFVRSASPILPDHQLIVFAKTDDSFFGILQSRIPRNLGATARNTTRNEATLYSDKLFRDVPDAAPVARPRSGNCSGGEGTRRYPQPAG